MEEVPGAHDGYDETYIYEPGWEQDTDTAHAAGLRWSGALPENFHSHNTVVGSENPSREDYLAGWNKCVGPYQFSWDNASNGMDKSPQVPALAPHGLAFWNTDDSRPTFPIQSSMYPGTWTDNSWNTDSFGQSSHTASFSTSNASESPLVFSPVSDQEHYPSQDTNQSTPTTQVEEKSPGAPADKDAKLTCINCSTQVTPLWRRNSEGLPICNACGLFVKLHGIDRPLALKTDGFKKRRRTSCISPQSRGSRRSSRPVDEKAE